MLYIGSVLWRKPDKILKKQFSASLKGAENEVFPVKDLTFKIFIFVVCNIRHFGQIFTKSCFIFFIDVWPLCYQWYTVTVSFLTILYALRGSFNN